MSNHIRVFFSKLFYCPGFFWGIFVAGSYLIFTQYEFIGWQLLLLCALILSWIKELERKNIYEECYGRKLFKKCLRKNDRSEK